MKKNRFWIFLHAFQARLEKFQFTTNSHVVWTEFIHHCFFIKVRTYGIFRPIFVEFRSCVRLFFQTLIARSLGRWKIKFLGSKNFGELFLGRQKWDIFGQLRPFLDTFSWYLKSDKDSVKTSIFHVAIFPLRI